MHDLMTDFETVTPDLWLANEQEWKEKLLKLPNWYQIPLINCNASHNLPDSTLVRFRGMIQDMHNPEFYFERFEIFNSETNEIKIKSGKYRDTAHVLENEKINYTQNLKSSQRQAMVVVSLPGYNEWAQEIDVKENHLKHLEDQPNTSKRLNQDSIKLKRSYEEADYDSDVMEVVDKSVAKKEQKSSESVEASDTSGLSREHLLNFPLPDTASKACIVKIYDESNNLKLNEMIEVVGFLSVDPALSGEFHQVPEPLLHPPLESEAETITHNPPPSLIPRVHAVYIKKLLHCNPLVKDLNKEEVLQNANEAREHLEKVFTELLLGDRLAADYLICHLISSVYAREEGAARGQFCLNVSEASSALVAHVYAVISQLVPTSYLLPLSVHNLNTAALLPRKDYECNRLTSGVLQLCAGTHLVLDETALGPGRLGPAGVANVAALGALVLTQKVEYDFKYYKMEFDCDVPVLIMSEGKSLLPSQYHVPLRAQCRSPEVWAAGLQAARRYLSAPGVLCCVRTFLTRLKLAPHCAPADTQFVEDDFVSMRRDSAAERPVTGEDLHRLLVLGRALGLARGCAALAPHCWELARRMEQQRTSRLHTTHRHSPL